MGRSTSTALTPARPGVLPYLELTKPLTWFPPMWAFGCGIVSSGQLLAERWPFALIGIALAGPLVCGTSQIVNDWFDRHVDAINEPQRPIPSGRVPGNNALWFAIAWTVLSVAVASLLGPWVLLAAIVGLALAWAYSAPPPRLKNNGWWGNAAVGLCYEGLPWFTAAAALSGGLPRTEILLAALLYSVGAHGIMTLNDFKAIAGDRVMNVRTLPVQYGPDRAAQIAGATMVLPQLVVVGLLTIWGSPIAAAAVASLIGAEVILMVRFLKDPVGKATWFSAFGVTLYVLGMLVTALAIRALPVT